MDILTIMYITFGVLIFTLGGVLGSFFECLADRSVKGISITKGRSYCPQCGHVLGVFDLFPIFSWLFLGGKCRYCKCKIPARHVIVETVSAVSFLLIYIVFGVMQQNLPLMLLNLFMISLLIPSSLTDLDTQTVENIYFILMAIGWAVYVPFSGDIKGTIINGLIGGLAIPTFLMIVAIIMEKVLHKDALGGADIKILFSIGLILGWKLNILNLMLTCFVGLFFIAIMKKVQKTDEVMFPLFPAIAVSTLITTLVGNQIINAYLSLF